MTTWSLNGPVYEGDRPTLNATFTDVDLTDLHTVDVSWGDDTFDSYTLPVGDRSFSVQKTAAYANETTSDLLIFITVSDPIFSNSKTLGVTVLNAAPSITSFGLSATAVEAGQAVTATGAFTDGGTADTHTVTINWGDGSPTTTASGNPFTTAPHTYVDAGSFTVTATVTDNAGAAATATSTVDVTTPNQAPSVVSFGVTAGNEGGSSTLAVTFADADALDTHTVSVVWGDGSPSDSAVELAAGVTTFDAAHVYADNGSYSVVLTLNDSAGHTVTASTSVSPTNVGPVVGSLVLSPSSVVDGELLTLSGTFTDPGTADTFTVTVDWGDGTSPEQQSLGEARWFSATHTYDAAGPVTITATVADRDNATSTTSVDLVVEPSNHAPTGLTLDPSVTGANVAVNVSFTDADADDTHMLTVSWGDGASTSQFLAAGTTTFTASHVYAASGIYTVAATVTDPDGESTSATTEVSVTVAAGSAANVVDEMITIVQSFGLQWQDERWLVRKLGDLKNSLVYGNTQVCSGTGQLSHILAFAQRNLTEAQYAELNDSAIRLRAAAGCSATASQLPKAVKTATVTTTVTSALTTQKKDTTTKDAAKAAKSDSKATAGRGSSH